MGPGFGDHFWRGLCAAGVLLFVAGLIIGAAGVGGCQALLPHVQIEWKP